MYKNSTMCKADVAGVDSSTVELLPHLTVGDGRSVRLDVENKKPEQILTELTSVAGVPR